MLPGLVEVFHLSGELLHDAFAKPQLSLDSLCCFFFQYALHTLVTVNTFTDSTSLCKIVISQPILFF